MKRGLPIWLLVPLCIIVEIQALAIQASVQPPGEIPWFVNLVVALRSGHDVVPANVGPPDYRMFRSVAELARRGRTGDLYEPGRFRRFEQKTRMKSDDWIYAPIAIPLTAFAGLSGFGRGFLIWTALLTLIAVLVLRAAGIPWLVTVATLFSPAAIWNFNLGQLGLISGALFVASLVWASDRPAASGIAAGLLTMKPQTGLLLPVIYLARGRYRAILIALVTFAALVGISLVLYGSGTWSAYSDEGLATAHRILVAPFPTPYEDAGISIFWMARSFGLDVSASYAAQVVSTGGAVVWCWLAWRDPEAAPWPRIALTACLATFVTPYGFVEDLCAFSLGIAMLAWHRGHVRPADLLFWALPADAFLSVGNLHVLVTPLVILLAAIYAHVEMKQVGRKADYQAVERRAALEST